MQQPSGHRTINLMALLYFAFFAFFASFADKCFYSVVHEVNGIDARNY
jgi:hypothetical protein